MSASVKKKMFLELPGLTASNPSGVFDKQDAGHKSTDGQINIAYMQIGLRLSF